MQTSYYRIDLVERGAKDLQRAGNIEQGTVEYLREVLGITQVGYRDWITVRAPGGDT